MHYISQVLIICFFVSCKNLPCAMLVSHVMELLFFIANSPKTSFYCLYYHSCEIFFDTFHLLMSSTSIPYLRCITYEIYMYQPTSSWTHKTAIENSQTNSFEITYLSRIQVLTSFTCFYEC